MKKKTYLILYTLILLILTIFNPNHSLYNMLIVFVIIILQYVLDRSRTKQQRCSRK
ncbi:hypothetical protein [Absicoccus intestinalis]|uniref:Uncharacterized protein n=1 Tax=Absicoccus intestinalis TaxID=2926319 RepID=A0ABU4WL72_9FIRM|nr:hypothetical protein [Absicoccus sp. CLA-KB-P134]MDX8417316.1 hypothetical protein [Absicoccus sp. CLA-KB-P134]